MVRTEPFGKHVLSERQERQVLNVCTAPELQNKKSTIQSKSGCQGRFRADACRAHLGRALCCLWRHGAYCETISTSPYWFHPKDCLQYNQGSHPSPVCSGWDLPSAMKQAVQIGGVAAKYQENTHTLTCEIPECPASCPTKAICCQNKPSNRGPATLTNTCTCAQKPLVNLYKPIKTHAVSLLSMWMLSYKRRSAPYLIIPNCNQCSSSHTTNPNKLSIIVQVVCLK